ncbi:MULTISPECIES: sensor histidine kinase [unclassified Phenylobacterium]|uniref:sensor histidine kinase n=1 Tax=unclassified Phenylobacterium TaxID=2640670 RepID=UPI0012E79040|nr:MULTISPECIES: histidine kinase [unclassified Phenylobacterium]
MPAAFIREIDRKTARQALWLTLAVWGLDIVFNLLPIAIDGRANTVVGASVLLIATVGCALSTIVYGAMARLRRRSTAVRYGALVALALACGAVNSAADLTLGGLLRDLIDPAAAQLASQRLVFRGVSNLFGLSWMFGLLGAFYMMLQANRALLEHERQLADARTAAAEAEGQATAARLAALRYQLNPHFLFNTLNAVSSAVITKRNDEAEDMLEKLAGFLRVTLAADPEGMIPLEDELANIQAYLEIESVRFRDRLGVDFSCPDDLRGAVVPSFILQPLIENAVKHGVSRATGAVTVRLEVARDGDDLVVLVEDDAERLGEPAQGGGVGLKNIRQRLEVLYGPRGVLQTTARERGFLAMVRMPLIRTLKPKAARRVA